MHDSITSESQQSKEFETVREIVRQHVCASGPVTAKEIQKYLKTYYKETEMWLIATVLNHLIIQKKIAIGDEGNTFQA